MDKELKQCVKSLDTLCKEYKIDSGVVITKFLRLEDKYHMDNVKNYTTTGIRLLSRDPYAIVKAYQNVLEEYFPMLGCD